VVTQDFTVRLERVFQGPLDLLLHLVREQEVEIHEIEINRVIHGYLEYLRALRNLDIELAGDFLVMAATLMSIKSRSLLPREEVDLEEELDPRDELIQRLIEYRRFKEASDDLGLRHELRSRQHARGDTGNEPAPDEPALELGELTAWDLLSAFSRLMRETLANRPHRIAPERRPLRFYVAELAERLRELHAASLRQLFLKLDERPTRESLIGSFCALLELVKLGLVSVAQESKDGDISIQLKPEHEADIESIVRSSIFDDEATEESESTSAGERAEADPAQDSSADDASDSEAERGAAGPGLVLLPHVAPIPEPVHAETEPG
jgi:segregation and condensation protein A